MAIRIGHVTSLKLNVDRKRGSQLLIKLDGFFLRRSERRDARQLVSAFEGIACAARGEITVLYAKNRKSEPRLSLARGQHAFTRHIEMKGQLVGEIGPLLQHLVVKSHRAAQ